MELPEGANDGAGADNGARAYDGAGARNDGAMELEPERMEPLPQSAHSNQQHPQRHETKQKQQQQGPQQPNNCKPNINKQQ